MYRWLARDAAVGSRAELTAGPAGQRPGDMGAVLDVITAVCSDAGAAAAVGSLLVAYRAWRGTRTHAPAFRIEKDGVTVVVDEASEQEIRQILTVMFPDSGENGTAEGAPGER